MAAVSCVIDVICNDVSYVVHEVESVVVTGITITVIIVARTFDLVLVYPQVCLKVRMCDIDSLIEDSHDD